MFRSLLTRLSILVLVVTGCSSNPSPTPGGSLAGERTRLDTLGMSLVLPQDWRIEPISARYQDGVFQVGGFLAKDTTVLNDSVTAATLYHSLIVERHDELGWWDRFKWARGMDRSRENHMQLVEPIPTGDVRMPFGSGRGFVYRFAEPGRPAVRLYVYYLTFGHRAYRISAGGSESDFEAKSVDYLQLLRSIQFDD